MDFRRVLLRLRQDVDNLACGYLVGDVVGEDSILDICSS